MKPFDRNARVCFIGDSITHHNGHVSRIAAYYKTHLSEAKVRIWNNGVSGGTARFANLILDSDVCPVAPTHAVILLGVNDSERGLLATNDPARDAKLDMALTRYRTEMIRLCERLKRIGCAIILCTPVPYAEFQHTAQAPLPGGNALIFRYAECVRALARALDCPLVDFHARMSELYLNEPLYGDDHVHPNERGHYRMAEYFLRAQGLEIDSYAPLADVRAAAGLTEWAAHVEKLRDVYATEKIFIPDSESMTFARKMQRVQELIRETETCGNPAEIPPWKPKLLAHYVEIAPQCAAYRAQLDQMTANWYD